MTEIWVEEYSPSFQNKLSTVIFDISQEPLLQRLKTCTATGYAARDYHIPSQ